MEQRMMLLTSPLDQKRIESDYYVEGIATTFEPYELFKDGGEPVYEQISRNAFAGAKMDDVILQFDHEGRVLARQSNGTLGMEVTDKGLLVWADLSKTDAARSLYEDIKSGMINKMSWRFRVKSRHFDHRTRTVHIDSVSEVFDVSAVSIPANADTTIAARKLIQRDKKEVLKMKIELERG